MKKILVTGATGFIGHYIIECLLRQNYRVIATSTSAANAQQAAWYSSVNYIPFNLKDFDAGINYVDYFENPDSIIHLAWEGLPNFKAPFHLQDNLPRHYAFLYNLISNGLMDITITGTCLEYGMKEGCLSEEMEAKPSNPYGMAKDLLRKQLQQLQQEKRFHLKWVRLFYMYGRGQNPNSLLSQLDKALANGEEVFNMSGGEQERDYLPVEKVAAYIVMVAGQDEVSGVINCCSGTPVKLRTFVENYLEKREKHIQLNLGYYPYADYEPMHFWGDDRKLNSIINK